MSVVIIGGNEGMEQRYRRLCEDYDCKVKIYTKQKGEIKNIGFPDLLILFTGTMSHKMLKCVMNQPQNDGLRIARSPQSSLTALKKILEIHTENRKGGKGNV